MNLFHAMHRVRDALSSLPPPLRRTVETRARLALLDHADHDMMIPPSAVSLVLSQLQDNAS